MESIGEQWNLPSPPDIISDSWMNITDAKKAVNIWILDRRESWGLSTQNNKTRLQLHCILSTCSFYIRVAQKNDFFGVTSFTPHDCPPLTHTQFKPRNSAWYLASRIELDVNINRHIKPREIWERAGLYHQLQTCHACRLGEQESIFAIQLMGIRVKALASLTGLIELRRQMIRRIFDSRQHTRIDLRPYLFCLDQLDRGYTFYGPFTHLRNIYSITIQPYTPYCSWDWCRGLYPSLGLGSSP